MANAEAQTTQAPPRDHGVAAPALPSKALAIISFAGAAAQRGEMMDQKSIARRLGIGENTLGYYVRTYAPVADALRPVLPLSAAQRILRALDRLIAEGAIMTQVLLAERADVGTNTISRLKAEDRELARRIDMAVASSLYRKVEALVRQRIAANLPITQNWLAGELGVGKSSIVEYKNRDPAICRLIEDARAPSASDRIRAAIEGLKADKVAPTVARIVGKAGVHQATVSKIKNRHAELAAAIADTPRPTVQMDRRQAEEVLAARIQLYGNERCNTVSALNRPSAKGGNRILLEACRRFSIPLPKAPPQTVDALVAYLHRIADTKPLFEEEAVRLWQAAKAGDREAVEELLVRTRPLVKFVIQNVLQEDIYPASFQHSLLEQLISQGDYLIMNNWEKWNGQEALLWYFGRILREGLREARIDFFRAKGTGHRLQSMSTSLAAADQDEDSFTLAHTRQMQSAELSPDINAGIMEDAFPFNEDELVTRRDTASGIRVILPLNKQVMAAALRDLFHAPALARAFGTGMHNDWAVFMAGSTGRLGTALCGECFAYLLILTDATAIFTRAIVAEIAARLAGRLREHAGTLPTVVIGQARNYVQWLKGMQGTGAAHRIPRKFVTILHSFGVGLSASNGTALIDTATVDAMEVGNSHLSDVELYFQTAKNGIVVAASRDEAPNALVRKLIHRMGRNGADAPDPALSRTANAIFNFELSFLEGQKALLEGARTGKTPAPGN